MCPQFCHLCRGDEIPGLFTVYSTIITKHAQRKMVVSAHKENREVQKGYDLKQEYCLLLGQGNTIFIEIMIKFIINEALPLVVLLTSLIL